MNPLIIKGFAIFIMALSVFWVLLDDKNDDTYFEGLWKGFFMAFVFANGWVLYELIK